MPRAWVLTNASGSAIERSTCVSAAKLTIASGRDASIAPATACGSSIAPLIGYARERKSAELKRLGLSIVIDGIDIKPDKDGGEHVVYKLADKTQAQDKLDKYIQMIKQPDAKVKGTGPDGQAFAFTVEFLKPNEKE